MGKERERDPLKEAEAAARDASISAGAENLVDTVVMVIGRAAKHATMLKMGLAAYGVQFDAEGAPERDSVRRLIHADHDGWRVVAAATLGPKAARLETVRAVRASEVYAGDTDLPVFDTIVSDVVAELEGHATKRNPFKGAGWIAAIKKVVGLG